MVNLYCNSVLLQGLHPRILTEGFELAKDKALEALELAKIPVESKRDVLIQVARISPRTKVHQKLADLLTEACVDAVFAINEKGL